MTLKPINIASYNRFEHFKYYLNHEMELQTTVNIDITKVVKIIKKRKLRTLPVIVWIISMAVNQLSAFKTTVNEDGLLCEYDVIHPGYLVLNKETKSFSCIFTPFTCDFQSFYNSCLTDMQLCETNKLFPLADEPKNIFSITTMPFLQFESFYVKLTKPSRAPIFATGKYYKTKRHVWLPISLQVHHAFCDGYHISELFVEIQNIINNFNSYI